MEAFHSFRAVRLKQKDQAITEKFKVYFFYYLVLNIKIEKFIDLCFQTCLDIQIHS